MERTLGSEQLEVAEKVTLRDLRLTRFVALPAATMLGET